MDKYGYQGIFFFSQDEDVKIFDAESGDELLEYELNIGELSSEYTEIEYLEVDSTGGPYIDTGLKVKSDEMDGYKIKAQYTTSNPTNNMFFGSWQSNPIDNQIGVYNGKIIWFVGNSGTNNITPDTDIHIFEANTSNLLLDGIPVGTPNWSLSPTINAKLFTASMGAKDIRIYYCEIYKNGQTIRKFIPAERNSDNVLGMYDVINNVFYTNDGSGSFAAGPIVHHYYHTIELPPQEIGYLTDSPFYKTAAETSTYFTDPTGLFTTFGGRSYYKHSAYEAYCGTVWANVMGNGAFTAEFVISKDYAAVKSSYMDQLFEDQYTTDYDGVSWKSVIGPYGWSNFRSPDPTTNFIDFSSEGTFASWADVIPRILQYIYEGQ